jgi:hypothetical protein
VGLLDSVASETPQFLAIQASTSALKKAFARVETFVKQHLAADHEDSILFESAKMARKLPPQTLPPHASHGPVLEIAGGASIRGLDTGYSSMLETASLPAHLVALQTESRTDIFSFDTKRRVKSFDSKLKSLALHKVSDTLQHYICDWEVYNDKWELLCELSALTKRIKGPSCIL